MADGVRTDGTGVYVGGGGAIGVTLVCAVSVVVFGPRIEKLVVVSRPVSVIGGAAEVPSVGAGAFAEPSPTTW